MTKLVLGDGSGQGYGVNTNSPILFPCITLVILLVQQHMQTLDKANQGMCPQEAILDNLAQELWMWQEEVDLVIVLTDLNDNVHSDDMKIFFAAFGLSEVIVDTWVEWSPNLQSGQLSN